MKYKNNTEDGDLVHPTAYDMNHHELPFINGVDTKVTGNLRYGNFYHQLLPFYEVFGDDGMIFLDGTNMGMIQNTSDS